MSTHVLTGPGRTGQAVSSPARIYSYLLGGRDDLAADLPAAENALSAVPHARQHRQGEPAVRGSRGAVHGRARRRPVH